MGGGAKLKSLAYKKAQMCLGYRANSDQCPRVKCYDLQDNFVPGGYNFPAPIKAVGFPKRMSMAISCLVGAARCDGTFLILNHKDLRLPIGYAADPGTMDTYGNVKTGNMVWSCGGNGHIYGHTSHGWHSHGSGITTSYDLNDELWMYNNACQNKNKMPAAVRTDRMDYMNLFQIRVQ